MKRSLGVFCFYDPQGIVDDYIIFILESLKEVLNEIIVVVNGEICNESYCKLANEVDYIVVRENKGYDAGAYKEILLNYCNVNEWDEIVLFNGTFYGPFVEWKTIFEKMQKYDFWGLYKNITYEKTYLASFFLVFEKNLIREKLFMHFWEQMELPDSYFSDFKVFEEPLVEYFSNAGYTWSDWYSENGGIKEDNVPIYKKHTLEELVKTYKMPVIKYKWFSVVYYMETLINLKFIIEDTSYNYELIEQHHNRLERINKMYPFSQSKLDDFISNYDAVYIYGHGVYGKGIANYCEYKGKQVKGFVVSKPNEIGEMSIRETNFDDRTGMIVAVGAGLVQEVRMSLGDFCSTDHILYPINS